MIKMDSFTDAESKKILLVGDISDAFLDPETVSMLPCEICTNVLDAIDTAVRTKFDVIAVVISGLAARLGAVLKALRDSNSDTRIVLLARMYEEPIARHFAGGTSDGTGAGHIRQSENAAADDYIICPIDADGFYQAVLRTGVVPEAELAKAITVDKNIVAKVRHLEKLATTDELTGLKNRRYILEFSRQIMDFAKAVNGRVTLLIFDIDDFKHYNDIYGHSAGDEILKQAAVLMQRCCRRHDVVGRIGGDEFAVVFWDEPRKESLEEQTERRSAAADHPQEPIFIARRFQNELERAELNLLGTKGKGVLTISGGLAGFPRDGETVEELFQQADKALLEAKRSGKNRIYLVGSPENDISKIK